MSAYKFTVFDAEGNPVSLEKYKGHVTLIVNVSRHHTKAVQSYQLLQSLYNKYRDEDLSVLLFPCSQFGPPLTSAAQEREFLVDNNLMDAGTVFKEVDINGPTTIDLFKYLKAQKRGTTGGFISCNFTIFILDRQGEVTQRLSTNVHPYVLEETIVKYL